MKTITVLVTPEVYSRIELAAIRDGVLVCTECRSNASHEAERRSVADE